MRAYKHCQTWLTCMGQAGRPGPWSQHGAGGAEQDPGQSGRQGRGGGGQRQEAEQGHEQDLVTKCTCTFKSCIDTNKIFLKVSAKYLD